MKPGAVLKHRSPSSFVPPSELAATLSLLLESHSRKSLRAGLTHHHPVDLLAGEQKRPAGMRAALTKQLVRERRNALAESHIGAVASGEKDCTKLRRLTCELQAS